MGRCLLSMAALAIFQAAVIDDEGIPVGSVVAVGTILAGMSWGCFVAGCAVGVADMVEHGRFPIIGVVAGGALKVVMGSRIFLQVAGNAIIVAKMIERGFSPIFCVCMAVDTWSRFTGKACGGPYWITAGANLLISRVKQCGFDDLAVMSGRVIGCMAGAAFKEGGVLVIF